MKLRIRYWAAPLSFLLAHVNLSTQEEKLIHFGIKNVTFAFWKSNDT